MPSITDASLIEKVQVALSKHMNATIQLRGTLNKTGARKSVGFEDLVGKILNRTYLLAIQPQDIEIQWPKKRKSSVYQFERSHLDAVEPWGVSKDVQILRLAYGPRTKVILKQRRAKLNAGKDPENALPKTRLRHRLAALLFASIKNYIEATTLLYSIHSFGFTSRSLLERSSWPPSALQRRYRFLVFIFSTQPMVIPTNGVTLHGRPYTMANGSTFVSV
jgi:hypothetical protein